MHYFYILIINIPCFYILSHYSVLLPIGSPTPQNKGLGLLVAPSAHTMASVDM